MDLFKTNMDEMLRGEMNMWDVAVKARYNPVVRRELLTAVENGQIGFGNEVDCLPCLNSQEVYGILTPSEKTRRRVDEIKALMKKRYPDTKFKNSLSLI